MGIQWGPSPHSSPSALSAHAGCGQTVAHLSYNWALVERRYCVARCQNRPTFEIVFNVRRRRWLLTDGRYGVPSRGGWCELRTSNASCPAKSHVSRTQGVARDEQPKPRNSRLYHCWLECPPGICEVSSFHSLFPLCHTFQLDQLHLTKLRSRQ